MHVSFFAAVCQEENWKQRLLAPLNQVGRSLTKCVTLQRLGKTSSPSQHNFDPFDFLMKLLFKGELVLKP